MPRVPGRKRTDKSPWGDWDDDDLPAPARKGRPTKAQLTHGQIARLEIIAARANDIADDLSLDCYIGPEEVGLVLLATAGLREADREVDARNAALAGRRAALLEAC